MAAVLIFHAAVSRQSLPQPINVPPNEVYGHRLGSKAIIHSSAKLDPWNRNVTLTVIVDGAGKVESVKATQGPEDFRSAAERLESECNFKPFVRHGKPVRVTFEDYVSILPPEQWSGVKMSFPEIKDWSTLKISLRRTTCYGDCPGYSLEIHGNGEVIFQGDNNTFVAGPRRGTISKQNLQRLVALFRQSNYFSLKDVYRYDATDMPAFTTAIEFDGVRKSVIDYAGLEVGMPEIVAELEDAIDRLSGSEKWVSGKSGP